MFATFGCVVYRSKLPAPSVLTPCDYRTLPSHIFPKAPEENSVSLRGLAIDPDPIRASEAKLTLYLEEVLALQALSV